jgi:hypothetical protein
MLWRFLSVLCVTVYSFLGACIGLVVAAVLGDQLDTAYAAEHGGDDGGSSAAFLTIIVCTPLGLIVGMVVGLAITGGLKRKAR